MARVKSIARRKHKKIRNATKGYVAARRKRVAAGKEAMMHAGQYAYVGRKLRKRNIRALWIMRLNAAVRLEGMSYSKFIAGLKREKIEIDRKMLADIAVTDPDTFKKIASLTK